ncbi:MAG TPA: hypothetical protein DC047_04255 [Blastocatellia bacterium]|nr:hypothetical protein [Blastocatellia bacterium]
MFLRNSKGLQLATGLILAVIAFATATVVVFPIVRDAHGDSPQVGPNQSKEKSLLELEKLRQNYAMVKSIHIVADAKVAVFGASFRVGKGSYEYWAEGDSYKMKCHTDPNVGLLADVDVAYDGKQFYFLDHASGTLSYQQQDVMKTTGALPNPLFMPVDFLSIDDDDCHFCALRMTDFKSASAPWKNRSSRLEVKSTSIDETTGDVLTDLDIPGGIKNKHLFKFRLRLAEAKDGKLRVTRIDRVGPDGKLLTTMRLDHFAPSALGEFPRTIDLEGFDEQGNLLARMTYTITTLEINQPTQNSAFAIGFNEADAVWDSDRRIFVKEKKLKVLRP